MENENLYEFKKSFLDIDLLETIKRDDLFNNLDIENKYINQIVEEEENNKENLNNIYENEVIKKVNIISSPNANHKRFKSSNFNNYNKQKNVLSSLNFIDTKLKKYKPKYKQNLNNKSNDTFTRLSQNKHFYIEKTIQNNKRSINKFHNTYNINSINDKNNINEKKNSVGKKNKNTISKANKNQKMKIDLNKSKFQLKNINTKSPNKTKINKSFNGNYKFLNKENEIDNLYEDININKNIQDYNEEKKEIKNINKYNITSDTSYGSNSNYIIKNKENNFENNKVYNINNNYQNPYFYNINEYYQPNDYNNNINYNNNNTFKSTKKVLKKSLSTDKIFQKKYSSNNYDNNINSNYIYEKKIFESPNNNKMNFSNNYILFNNKDDESQNYFMKMKKNNIELMNFNQQKKLFSNERIIKRDNNRKKSMDVINFINDNHQNNMIYQINQKNVFY